MAGSMNKGDGRRGIPLRMFGWSIAGLILLFPLVANAPWTLSDFVVMGVLLGGAGLVLELAVRASDNVAYRAGAGVAVAAAFLLIWVTLAVGFLGSEDNLANLMFLGVLAIALLGSVVAGFESAGMARAMSATAAAQLLVGAIGLAAGLGSPGHDGLYEAVTGTSVFAALWLASAGLFRKAARQQAPATAAP